MWVYSLRRRQGGVEKGGGGEGGFRLLKSDVIYWAINNEWGGLVGQGWKTMLIERRLPTDFYFSSLFLSPSLVSLHNNTTCTIVCSFNLGVSRRPLSALFFFFFGVFNQVKGFSNYNLAHAALQRMHLMLM